MVSKTYSLRDAITILKQHRDKLEAQIGKSKMEQLLFNLEEISLDIESVASKLMGVATKNDSLEEITEIFDFFQYGSIPHIIGHLETIEETLENNTSSDEPSDEIASLHSQ